MVQSNLDSAVVLRSRSSIVLKLSSNRRDCKEIRTMPTSFDYFIDEMSATILIHISWSIKLPAAMLGSYSSLLGAVLGSDSSGSSTPGSHPAGLIRRKMWLWVTLLMTVSCSAAHRVVLITFSVGDRGRPAPWCLQTRRLWLIIRLTIPFASCRS